MAIQSCKRQIIQIVYHDCYYHIEVRAKGASNKEKKQDDDAERIMRYLAINIGHAQRRSVRHCQRELLILYSKGGR